MTQNADLSPIFKDEVKFKLRRISDPTKYLELYTTPSEENKQTDIDNKSRATTFKVTVYWVGQTGWKVDNGETFVGGKDDRGNKVILFSNIQSNTVRIFKKIVESEVESEYNDYQWTPSLERVASVALAKLKRTELDEAAIHKFAESIQSDHFKIVPYAMLLSRSDAPGTTRFSSTSTKMSGYYVSSMMGQSMTYTTRTSRFKRFIRLRSQSFDYLQRTKLNQKVF